MQALKSFIKFSMAALAVLSFCGYFSTAMAANADQAAPAASKQWPEYPKVEYGTGEKAEMIRRGEYLAKAGDCIACHTAPGGKPFAGGLKINSPFGYLYTPNITPDKKTGIGDWTEAQFYKAMHDGISPKGHYYYPAFPYNYFTKLSKADVAAIKAYLDAIPAVDEKNKADGLKWPFKYRFLQLGWRILFFRADTYQENPKQSKEWNRGAFLVQGLGHCSMCHTPMNVFAAPKQKYYLHGNFIEGYYAPDITSAALSDIPVAQIVRVFKGDKLIHGGNVQGPMLEVNHDSLQHLDDSDLEAIAVYLKTVKSEAPPKKNVGTGLKAGKEIYGKYCVGCHGTGAGGAPKFGNADDWAPKIALGMKTLYQNAIHGIGGMPPKGTCASCTDKQIEYAVDYIVAESKPKAGEKIGPVRKASPMPDTSVVLGEKIYGEACAECHTKGALGAPVIGDKTVWAPLIAQNMDVLFSKAIKHYQEIPYEGKKYDLTNAEVIAAVKYIVQQSKTSGNYQLW